MCGGEGVGGRGGVWGGGCLTAVSLVRAVGAVREPVTPELSRDTGSTAAAELPAGACPSSWRESSQKQPQVSKVFPFLSDV